jgi:hypothetical protein
MDFAGETEAIWTRDSINHRRLILAASYVSCLPLFTICLIAVVQAIACGAEGPHKPGHKTSTPKPDRRVGQARG